MRSSPQLRHTNGTVSTLGAHTHTHTLTSSQNPVYAQVAASCHMLQHYEMLELISAVSDSIHTTLKCLIIDR